MTQTDLDTTDNESTQSSPVRILWLVAGALVFGCACSLGALLLLRQANNIEWFENLWPFKTATATALPATSTPTLEPTPTTVATSTAAALPTTTATPTATQTATATATQTAAATPTPTATWTATREASPTPFVCDSIYELAYIQLAPEQTFQCTLQEQELTDLANDYPDSPCSETRFTFDDGEIGIERRIGVRMKATLEAQTENCRIVIEIVKGTPGFKQIVQQLITTQFDVIKYDTICINQIESERGQITVGGYGR